jgi:hypothetical protein
MGLCELRIHLWCWNIWNSDLYLEVLWRSELTVQCTNAFNTILSMPRSTKYSFFSLQLQFLSLFHRTFQCCNVKLWSKQTIPLTLAKYQLWHFTNLPITSFRLWSSVLTSLLLNILNVCPSLSMTDMTHHHCNINKWQVKHTLHSLITFCLQTDRQTER